MLVLIHNTFLTPGYFSIIFEFLIFENVYTQKKWKIPISQKRPYRFWLNLHTLFIKFSGPQQNDSTRMSVQNLLAIKCRSTLFFWGIKFLLFLTNYCMITLHSVVNPKNYYNLINVNGEKVFSVNWYCSFKFLKF